MQVGIKILKITKALHGDCSTGFGIVIGYWLESNIGSTLSRRIATQFCQKTAIEHEIDSQPFGNAEHPLPMRYIF